MDDKMDQFHPENYDAPLRIQTIPEMFATRLSGGKVSRFVRRSERDRTTDDRQNPYEAILLAPGEKKIEVTIDTRLPSAAIFTFHKEDHTLANLLRCRLFRHPHVIFSAYKIPHPLTPNFELRVQTDGEVTPRLAVIQVCQSVIKELGILSRNFTKEYELRKMANAANQQQAQD